MVICFSACIGLPTFVAVQTFNFLNSNETKTNQRWITAPNYNYPYIAICHPKVFNVEKLEGEKMQLLGSPHDREKSQSSAFHSDHGIDNNMANYMTTIFDTSFLARMTTLVPEFGQMVANLAPSLDSLLVNKNMTMHQLFLEVAIKYELKSLVTFAI